MTSRPVPAAGGSPATTVAGSPVAGPGDRPHLPPVAPSSTSRRTRERASGAGRVQALVQQGGDVQAHEVRLAP